MIYCLKEDLLSNIISILDTLQDLFSLSNTCKILNRLVNKRLSSGCHLYESFPINILIKYPKLRCDELILSIEDITVSLGVRVELSDILSRVNGIFLPEIPAETDASTSAINKLFLDMYQNIKYISADFHLRTDKVRIGRKRSNHDSVKSFVINQINDNMLYSLAIINDMGIFSTFSSHIFGGPLTTLHWNVNITSDNKHYIRGLRLNIKHFVVKSDVVHHDKSLKTFNLALIDDFLTFLLNRTDYFTIELLSSKTNPLFFTSLLHLIQDKHKIFPVNRSLIIYLTKEQKEILYKVVLPENISLMTEKSKEVILDVFTIVIITI